MSKFLILERFTDLKSGNTEKFTVAINSIRELTPFPDGTILETVDGKMYYVRNGFDELNQQLDAMPIHAHTPS